MTSSWLLGFINIDNLLVFPSTSHIAENTIYSATPDRSPYFAQLAWPMIVFQWAGIFGGDVSGVATPRHTWACTHVKFCLGEIM